MFGGLDLHGIKRNVSWTQLSETAIIGSDVIILQEATDWAVGEEIMIAPTSFSAWETEIYSIVAVADAGTRLTLNETLKHSHIGKELVLGLDVFV